MADTTPKIIYTKVDEAPALASASWFPIVKAYCQAAGIVVDSMDISLAGRIIAQFPEGLTPEQVQSDDLARLGELVETSGANIIKLPNISASVPQIKAAIAELQSQGYELPDYPEDPKTPDELTIKAKYDTVKGSAVNPVLRQGNSDRRSADAVKQYAQQHPHRMGQWSPDSKTHVAHMVQDDFYASETSLTVADEQAGTARIEFMAADGERQVMQANVSLESGDIVDSAHLGVQELRSCITKAKDEAKAQGILLSLHLKATMMKVSDPIMFGHAVEVYFDEVFAKHAATFAKIGVNSSHGLGDVLTKIQALSKSEQKTILADIDACLQQGPELAMVDSEKGITNLNVPSDVIVDASMAALMRAGGKMWGSDGKTQDTIAIIPDRSYARMYQAAIDFCREHGAFDPATMGSVANVGLMAQKAEEYGSHDKTFAAPADGKVQVISQQGDVLLEQAVKAGDIFRCCVVKDIAIADWVKLAVSRGQIAQQPVVFWLDEERAHDAEMIKKVNVYLAEQDTTGLTIEILAPAAAMQYSLDKVARGENVIAATGNVLRDYLTDLFPILELGTSAKMLSIVPLLAGGGLFETGAGGSAPKHVQQFQAEGHLRWDSLGEFMALAESLAHYARAQDYPPAQVMAAALEQATAKLLQAGHSPGRKAGELSNSGSHVYEALYWAQALAAQQTDKNLQQKFQRLAQQLQDNLDKILQELQQNSGKAVEIGGYYHPDAKKVEAAIRTSKTFNAILQSAFS